MLGKICFLLSIALLAAGASPACNVGYIHQSNVSATCVPTVYDYFEGTAFPLLFRNVVFKNLTTVSQYSASGSSTASNIRTCAKSCSTTASCQAATYIYFKANKATKCILYFNVQAVEAEYYPSFGSAPANTFAASFLARTFANAPIVPYRPPNPHGPPFKANSQCSTSPKSTCDCNVKNDCITCPNKNLAYNPTNAACNCPKGGDGVKDSNPTSACTNCAALGSFYAHPNGLCTKCPGTNVAACYYNGIPTMPNAYASSCNVGYQITSEAPNYAPVCTESLFDYYPNAIQGNTDFSAVSTKDNVNLTAALAAAPYFRARGVYCLPSSTAPSCYNFYPSAKITDLKYDANVATFILRSGSKAGPLPKYNPDTKTNSPAIPIGSCFYNATCTFDLVKAGLALKPK